MKYVLIIGAKNELGIELANLYARNNYNLYLAGRSIKDIQDKSSEIEKKYKVKSVLCELDVTDYNSHQKIYDTLIIKPIGVIYLAGYYPNIPLSTSKWSETVRTIEINYLGCMSLLNIISNQFINDRRGFIISVTSVSGLRGRAKNYIYGSAKAGLITYMSGLRNKMNKYNVNVLTVIPGFITSNKDKKENYPRVLVTTPKKLASRIFNAQQSNKDVIYSSISWQLIMFVIKIIPEALFKKLKI
jgi:short-subunit dehydrogenase